MELKNFIICSDFDGTLTGHLSDIESARALAFNNICEENVRAIEKITENGGRFIVASGRTPKKMLHLYEHLPLDDVFAGTNGTALYSVSEDKFIQRHAMRLSPAEIIGTVMKNLPWITCFHISDYETVVRIWTPDKGDPVEFAKKTDRALKIVFDERDNEKMRILEEFTHKTFADTCEVYKSCEILIEMNDKGAGKGEIIEFFRTVEPKKITVALGDYENDLSMLMAADYAFCPENALPEIKAVCDKTFRASGDGFIMDVVEYLESL